jgi:hypothetical protein
MTRGLCGALALLLVSGCGPTFRHGAARNVLIALTVGSAALAVGAAVKSRQVQNDLRSDLDAGKVTGQDFVDRDASGNRWNRIARAAGFSAGVFALGLVLVAEMGAGDRIQDGPREWTPADDARPIFPPGAPAGAPAPGGTSAAPSPDTRNGALFHSGGSALPPSPASALFQGRPPLPSRTGASALFQTLPSRSAASTSQSRASAR